MGRFRGKPRENHGKIMENHGKLWKTSGKSWEILDKSWKTMENLGKIMGKFWTNRGQNMENHVDTPSHLLFLDQIFHEIKHPAIGENHFRTAPSGKSRKILGKPLNRWWFVKWLIHSDRFRRNLRILLIYIYIYMQDQNWRAICCSLAVPGPECVDRHKSKPSEL